MVTKLSGDESVHQSFTGISNLIVKSYLDQTPVRSSQANLNYFRGQILQEQSVTSPRGSQCQLSQQDQADAFGKLLFQFACADNL